MNLEDLTKSQLLLLTILVNFVTSIATGILTVSLLDQVPPVVSQTVNRIVEHTVETVTQAPAAVIAAPQTSVEDLITAAFAAEGARRVQIYVGSASTSTPAVAEGMYLPKTRAIVTATSDELPSEVLIQFADGTRMPASLAHADTMLSIFGFADSAKLPSAPALTLLAEKNLKVGQTALTITLEGDAVTGIISRIAEDGIHTTLPLTRPGTAAVDLSGNLIGVFSGGTPGIFVSADYVRALLASTSTPAKNAQ